MKFDMYGEDALTDDEKLDRLMLYYDRQRLETQRQEYLSECAFKNLLNEVSRHSYAYSFVDFNSAQKEFSSKKGSANIKVIKNKIAADFFNDDDNFEITRILACGFDTYGWNIDICKDSHNISFFFPMRDRINEENYEYMLYGKIRFYNVCSNYNIEKVAEAVKDYFNNI